MVKMGILIATVGTTVGKTLKQSIDCLEHEIKEKYPKCIVKQSFTSDRIRQILRERDGIFVPDVGEALLQLRKLGTTHVLILPTHLIAGSEYEKIEHIVSKYTDRFKRVLVAKPLLSKDSDFELVANALYTSNREKNEDHLILYVGHGSDHIADICYQKMQHYLQKAFCEKVFLTTIRGNLQLNDIVEQLKVYCDKNQNVLLYPFMFVAGGHADRDLIHGEHSIKNSLEQAGFQVEYEMKGLGEMPQIRQIYLFHLQQAIEMITE